MKHTDLQKRLVEETIRIATDGMTAGVKPQFRAFALDFLEARVPQIEVTEFGNVNIQLAEVLGFHRFNAANTWRDLVHTVNYGGVTFFMVNKRFIGNTDEESVLPVATLNYLLPHLQAPQIFLAWFYPAGGIGDVLRSPTDSR